ncbi:alpha-mannosidase, partial [Candidatus Hydrogenedentota bacterium]
LKDRRYKKVGEVELEIAETMEYFRKPPAGLKYKKAPVGAKWGKEWGSAWFKGRIRVPKDCKGQRIYYRMVTMGEMLLFVGGKPAAGLDHMHHEALLLKKARGGESLGIHIEAYAGHRYPEVDPYVKKLRWHQSIHCPPQSLPLSLRCSELLVEREDVAGLFYDLDVLYRTAMTLDENSMRRVTILDRLTEVIDMVPHYPESDEELGSACRAARRRIADLLKIKNGPTTPRVGLVGHTHIDVGWLWPVRESIRKSARTFSTHLNLMNDYLDMTFLQSQPKLMEMVEEHYPELLPEIRKRVKEGRWEPNGGMYVEADCNLAGGEALIRQFLEGWKITKRLFGYQGDTLWLPDVFGYSAALPQILRKCEIENFVTSKINWNDTNRFPYDTFLWEGIDGTEVFTHFMTCGYNAEVYPEVSKNCWDSIQIKEVQDNQICSVGYGDGGGGVTREMCENARRMKDLEGCVKTEFVNGSKFLKRLREQDIERPRWVGELYLELHRGTYTTQAKTKRHNRKLELMLRDVEFLCTLAMPLGFKYPAAELERNWRVLLNNQFHDILPGSSIRTVYAVTDVEYARVKKELGALREKALKKLTGAVDRSGAGTPYVIANTLSWHRKDLVVIDGPHRFASDSEGNSLLCQYVEGSGLAVEVSVGSMSVASIFLGKSGSDHAESPFKQTANTLNTPFYRVKFDKSGMITGLYDKEARREVVRRGRRLNEFYSAEDLPSNWDAWEISPWYRNQIVTEDRLISRKVVSEGPLFITYRSRYKIGKQSELAQDMTFYANFRRIDCKTEVDWQETHIMLKVGFPVDVHADTTRQEIQYGHLVRNTHQNTSYDRAKFETCAHKWVDISENGYGVAILNDCKYGCDTLDKMVSLTLLRSPVAPDELADKGHHEFTYSILPHCGDFSVEGVVRDAYELNVPLIHRKSSPGRAAAKETGLCMVSNPNVIIEAVKRAEEQDATIIRMYEAGRSRGPVTVNFHVPVKKAAECNMLERLDKPVAVKNNSITFDILPFEIKTLKVCLK